MKPEDNHSFVLRSVYLMGLAFILPWQILVIMSGYWDQKFSQYDPKEFGSYLTIVSTVPHALTITLHAVIGHWFSIRTRLYCSQIGFHIHSVHKTC